MSYSRWPGLLAGFFLLAAGLSAQVAGSLSGRVVDQSGAPIPGATVNVFVAGGTEPLLSGNTNQAGMFLFSTVRPGTYEVSFEAQGFGKALVSQADVSALQEKNLGDIKLQVHGVTESVEVTAEVTAIDTTSGELAKTITNQQIQNLPLSGRQISNLFATIPGVSSGSNTTAVNGLHSSFSNVTLDGVNIQDNFIRTNALDYAPMRTTIDQVAEITVSTTNQQAAIGGGSSQFTMVTRSGTNSYHGAVYWFIRNSALAANDWFNNRDGSGKSKVNLNQPGLALGGPVKKDKLFFYSNYEWYRNKTTSSQTRTVLTDSARQGLFTYRAGQANLHNLRNFTDNPAIKAMIGQLPAPNAPGGDSLNTSGYRFNALSDEFRDQFVFRGDYYLSTKHNFSGTYDYIDNPTKRPDVTANFYTTVPPVNNTIRDHLMALSWRWLVSPTLTNELRGGFMRAATGFLDVDSKYPTPIVAGTVFTNPINNFLNQGRDVNTYNIQDNANWVRGKHQMTFGYQGQLIHVAPWNDGGIIPTYTLGVSTANTNGLTAAELPGSTSAERTRANNLYSNLAGIISSAAQTFNVTSTTSGFVDGATNRRQLQYSTHALYFQDTWKVRPNLTLNLGMRYEYWQPLDEKHSLYLAPVLQSGNIQGSLVDPNLTLDFIGKSSGRPFYQADKNNFAPNVGIAWRPVEHDSLTIRGGYMASYVNDNVVTSVQSAVSASSGLSFAGSLSNQTGDLASPPPVPKPTYKVPRSMADNFALSTTTTTGIPDPGLQTPVVHQFNLSVEREVKGFLVAGRYVGNRTHGLLRQIDYDQVLYDANGFLADFRRAQSNALLAQNAGLGYNGSFNSAIPGSQALTVFPLLANGGSLASSATVQTYLQNGQIGELANSYMVGKTNGSVNFWPNKNAQAVYFLKNGADGTYNALQLEATKRTRSGLQVQFSYTFSKSLSNIAGDRQTGREPLLDNANPGIEWARSPYDLTHVLKVNYYYELPFGKGKRWAGNAFTNHIIGGWAFSGIWSYQSGAAYSILSGWGTLNRNANSAATNTASVNGTTFGQLKGLTSGVWKTGDNVFFLSPALIGPEGLGASAPGTDPFAGQIFYNPTAGNVGNLQRRMFSGPWEWSWDLSLVKKFHFGERVSMDYHFDVFNYANHPTFYVYPTTSGDYSYNGYNTINNTTFGTIDSMQYSPRVIQMGLYLRF